MRVHQVIQYMRIHQRGTGRLWLLIVVTLIAQADAVEPLSATPSFVINLDDDLGYGDLGCYGATRARVMDGSDAGTFLPFHLTGKR